MLTLRVLDEFGKLKSVLVHSAENAIDISLEDWERTVPPDDLHDHPETRLVLKEEIIKQHAQLRELLNQFGIVLHTPIVQTEAFCQVFTRDPSFVVGQTLFISAMRDEYRKPETAGLDAIRAVVPQVIDLAKEDVIIEGGDVMVLDGGRLVLIGMNRHTNEAGFRKLAIHLQEIGARAVCVPHKALHLDCCLAPLPNGEAVYVPDKIPEQSLNAIKPLFQSLIPLDREEASIHLAANLLWVDRTNVVSSAASPKTNQLLRLRGYQVHEMDFSHLIGCWGSFRCVTCPLERN